MINYIEQHECELSEFVAWSGGAEILSELLKHDEAYDFATQFIEEAISGIDPAEVTDFCNDDTVQEALCDIVADHVDNWFQSSRRVALGIESSRVARQQVVVEAARVLGMMDLVCSITGLTPEDIVEFNPYAYRELVLYVVNYK